MKNKQLLVLTFAVGFQFLVLTGMVISAAMPLWTGTEIRVKTIPVDPRSMFRGNYARLRYEFSSLDNSEFPEQDLRIGEVVYVSVLANSDNVYEFSKVTIAEPAGGVYLRGRTRSRANQGQTEKVSIEFGIEAWFAPKEKALELERSLRHGGIAVLMVTKGGKARLKDIVGE